MKNLERLETFILTDFGAGLNKKKLDPDEDLLEQGIIDSLGIMRVIVFMEETFGIKVIDEEIVPDNFQTLNNMVNFIEQKVRNK